MYTKKSWINKSVPKNYMSLAKWCKKNNFQLQFAHNVLKKHLQTLLGKIKYFQINKRNICFIEKNVKRNELLISKQHKLKKEFKNFITIKEFCKKNKLNEFGLRSNFEFLPPGTIKRHLFQKLILKTTEPNCKKIKLNFLKRTFKQDFISASDFAKLNHLSRTRILQLIKTLKIKNTIKMLGRWYVLKNTKIKKKKNDSQTQRSEVC